jgi:hypothetical protein
MLFVWLSQALFSIPPAIITPLAPTMGEMGPLGRPTINTGVKLTRPTAWSTGWLLAANDSNLRR